jgi:hypothetical protein
MIYEVLRDRSKHTLAQFTGLTEILFPRHISKARLVAHGVSVDSKYSASHWIIYMPKILPSMYCNVISGQMEK